jgi:hypothetical protein
MAALDDCYNIFDINHRARAWLNAFGYTRCALAEAAIGRWKQMVGDGLRAHADERRASEVEVRVAADTLNRMLELGRPKCVRVA